MKKTAFLVILNLLLLACAYNNYGQKLQQYIGQTEQSLIENFGKPTGKTVVSNEKVVLTYIKWHETYMPMEYFYDTPGFGADDIVYDPFFVEYTFMPTSVVVDSMVEGICKTSFVITNGVVTSYRYQGDACN